MAGLQNCRKGRSRSMRARSSLEPFLPSCNSAILQCHRCMSPPLSRPAGAACVSAARAPSSCYRSVGARCSSAASPRFSSHPRFTKWSSRCRRDRGRSAAYLSTRRKPLRVVAGGRAAAGFGGERVSRGRPRERSHRDSRRGAAVRVARRSLRGRSRPPRNPARRSRRCSRATRSSASPCRRD